ncbi:hypothetical protein, partial [Corynebacterium xerosis]|uniref:hypothetical protein n=1 Tax=Corynebacterium xerosis TaxID=1725 RepID=UPI0027BA644D
MGGDIGIAFRRHGDGQVQLVEVAGPGEVGRRFVTFGGPPLARGPFFSVAAMVLIVMLIVVIECAMVDSHVDSPVVAMVNQE